LRSRGWAIGSPPSARVFKAGGTGLPDGEMQYLGPQDPNKVSELLVFGGPSAVPAAAIAAFEKTTGEGGWSYFENRQTPSLR
jgi:hypothetical protein